MLEAAYSSETSASSELHGVTTHKTVLLKRGAEQSHEKLVALEFRRVAYGEALTGATFAAICNTDSDALMKQNPSTVPLTEAVN
jgi:hypothetical protein